MDELAIREALFFGEIDHEQASRLYRAAADYAARVTSGGDR